MVDATLMRASGSGHPLPSANPESLGLDPERLELLYQAVRAGVSAGEYPGATIAIARHGKLAVSRTFGQARIGAEATDDALWLMFSQTKPVTTAVIWQLMERGKLAFDDRIADHMPEFARHGKGDITLYHVLTHQGGYPIDLQEIFWKVDGHRWQTGGCQTNPGANDVHGQHTDHDGDPQGAGSDVEPSVQGR